MLSKKRLERNASFIICALKKLPKTLRRSNGCEGQPWIVSRHILSQDKDYALDVMDRLLAMAVGLDMVTVSIPEGAPSDMPYIIIEDERIRARPLQERDMALANPEPPPPLHRSVASVMQEWIRLYPSP